MICAADKPTTGMQPSYPCSKQNLGSSQPGAYLIIIWTKQLLCYNQTLQQQHSYEKLLSGIVLYDDSAQKMLMNY